MDKIQKVLVKAGRKDLAQKYYKKISVMHDVDTKSKAEVIMDTVDDFKITGSLFDSKKNKRLSELWNKIWSRAEKEKLLLAVSGDFKGNSIEKKRRMQELIDRKWEQLSDREQWTINSGAKYAGLIGKFE